MTTVKTVTRILRDLAAWAPLLDHAHAAKLGLHSPHPTVNNTTSIHDLATKITQQPDPDDGATGITTHAQLTQWATTWAECADLTYTGSPLHALADNANKLAENWVDWEAFADDATTLHTHIAHITGHTPRVIGPCPHPGCAETVTQAQTRRGAEGPLECPRGHTYQGHAAYQDAARAEDMEIVREAETTTLITIASLLQAWPELTRDDVKNWIRTGRLTAHRTRRGKSIPLGPANTLARQLLNGRQQRAGRDKHAQP